MSERPAGSGAETLGTPTPPAPTFDEALAVHLQRRGAHEPPRTLAASIVARVAETAPERRWRLTLAVWRPRLAVAVSGMTLALLAGLLFFGAPAPRTTTTQGSPTPSALPTTTGLTWDPTQRALTPPEFLRILATHPAPGTVLIVDDQLVGLLVSCVSADYCPDGRLVNAGVDVGAPPGGHLPFDATSEIAGPLALQVSSGAVLVFLGSVVSGGLRMSFKASDVLANSGTGGLFVIPAWLSEAGPVSCPTTVSTPPPAPTSELGLPAPQHDICAGANYLTDTAPTLPLIGSPRDGLMVQGGAYQAFRAPSGDRSGPSQAIYLVRDWGGYGEILARLEPMPIPSADAVAPSSPITAGGVVLSVDELVGRVLSGSLPPGSPVVASIPATAVTVLSPSAAGAPDDPTRSRWIIVAGSRSIRVDGPVSGIVGFLVEPSQAVRALGQTAVADDGQPLAGLAAGEGLSVVHGWLRTGPRLPCPAPRAPTQSGTLGGRLGWSQCPGTWILPTSDDPWAGPPNNVRATDGSAVLTIGDASVPAGTLHVQDGADRAGLAPQEGSWLVRVAASSAACPPGSSCPTPPPNHPPPGVRWFELIGPVAAPDPTASPTVIVSQDRLVAGITSGAYRTGSILIARATIAPVILSSFPPDQGAIVGKIGSISVHWGSDPGIGVSDPRPIALRVRADGGLDYLGPAILDPGDQPFASSDRPRAQGLLLVHGWFYRPTVNLRCPEPSPSGSPHAFKAFDGQIQDLACDPAWILPSAEDPLKIVGGSQILDIPNGGLPVQIRDAPSGAPAAGVFLVRYVACEWSGSLDVCRAPARYTWELVGPVFVPGP